MSISLKILSYYAITIVRHLNYNSNISSKDSTIGVVMMDGTDMRIPIGCEQTNLNQWEGCR